MRIYKLRLILLISLFLMGGIPHSPLFSQPVLFGVKGGLSIPDLKGGDTPQSEGYTSRLAPAFGIYINYGINSHFELSGEVLYAGQGGKRNGMQPIFAENLAGLPVPAGMALYADFKNNTILNYLEIPILARYSFFGKKSGFDVYLDVGPYLGILLNATVKTTGTSIIYLDKQGTTPLEIGGNPLPPQSFDNEVDILDKLNKTNLGITGGLGMIYNFNEQELRFDLRGDYGFIPIQADKENGSNNIGAITITLGYGFNI